MRNEQKLVTVFLHDKTAAKNKAYGDPEAGPFFGIREHLQEYLQSGWQIRQLETMGGAGGCLSGWLVVLLEKTPY